MTTLPLTNSLGKLLQTLKGKVGKLTENESLATTLPSSSIWLSRTNVSKK